MEKLVNLGLKLVAKEKRLVDKMLVADEEENDDLFLLLRDYYKGVKEKTDSVVSELLARYSFEDIANYIDSLIDPTDVKTLDYACLFGFIDYKYLNDFSQKKFKIDSDCFVEEHNKTLYSLYIWYMRNNELPKDFKASLHKFMSLRAADSQFVRLYYEGNNDLAFKISSPDASFYWETYDFAEKAYYSHLNKLILDSDCCEFFEGLSEPHVVDAKRKLLELELAALCYEMDARKIQFPVAEAPLNDYSLEMLRNASDMYNSFNENKEKRLVKKPIYL